MPICTTCNDEHPELQHNCPNTGHEHCENCTEVCTVCRSDTCETCSTICSNCDRHTCPDCLSTCSGCETVTCNECIYSCSNCRDSLCSSCTHSCSNCSDSLCDNCRESCDQCGGYLCSSCLNTTDCESRICGSCSCDCDTCNPSDNPEIVSEYNFNYNGILDYGWKPYRIEYLKESWENTLYLGWELELEHQGKESQAANIVNQALDGYHVLKYDGSIQNGFEIVTSPGTLQYWNKVNLSKMLKELSALGCTSYNNERCGFHIHVNKSFLTKLQLRVLKRFFCATEHGIKVLSQRSDDSFNSWSKIPRIDHWLVEQPCRYVAVNETKETLEFRIFRGTLKHTTIKAYMQFTDSIMRFISQFRVEQTPQWRDYVSFVKRENRYNHLVKYLKNKRLLY